ncbi:AraC family transcriptional regulator [Vibrio sp. Isolate30]|uniref:AraC family transcriptional regulator n=1 Tax=Vibrio sp. Isolate30 TaxID=2908536 RepID=UPI001EFD7DBB|nr:AraC family transcriptional regulator [Vibrio sp. Isolate30]MCG9633070.1 AraC family transcriptional regulator [Vibrio sp. Isolate30]
MKQNLKDWVANRLTTDGMIESRINGVHLFKVTNAVPCAPAIYDPALIVILNGKKEAILEGDRYVYDSKQYMCCVASLPVEAGTPEASVDDPLIGVYVSLDTKVMKELTIEMEETKGCESGFQSSINPQSLMLSDWDEEFTDALYRLVTISDNVTDSVVLGEGRLRELYYAVLKGDCGPSVRKAFSVGNGIARAIEHLSMNLEKNVSIDELASLVGMSRAVLHRKFKQATNMSPIQFMKSMRLNSAAMKIATGTNVSEAAMEVGYVSSSQFSREFKRLYGQSPKQWVKAKGLVNNIA